MSAKRDRFRAGLDGGSEQAKKGERREFREDRVAEDEDESDVEFYTPEELKVLNQEVELLNGVKMSNAEAQAEFASLCELFEENPKHFEALVTLAKSPTAPVPTEIRAALADDVFLDKNGAVHPQLAAVLDAAYIPNAGVDSVPLRYPIRHSGREQIDEINKLYDLIPGTDVSRRVSRFLFDKDKPKDEGPSR